MAAPYRANHQHKVKAPTSEDSKRYRAKPCRSLRQSLYRSKPTKRVQKSNKTIAKKSITKRCRSGILCTAFVAKMFGLFGGDHFFIQIIFRELGNQF